jgi:hypothetical protein
MGVSGCEDRQCKADLSAVQAQVADGQKALAAKQTEMDVIKGKLAVAEAELLKMKTEANAAAPAAEPAPAPEPAKKL